MFLSVWWHFNERVIFLPPLPLNEIYVVLLMKKIPYCPKTRVMDRALPASIMEILDMGGGACVIFSFLFFVADRVPTYLMFNVFLGARGTLKGSVSRQVRHRLLYIIRKLFIKLLSMDHFYLFLLKGYAAIYVLKSQHVANIFTPKDKFL